MIFLSCPYSSKDPAIVEARMKLFLRVDAFFTKLGLNTVSPLYKHILVQAGHDVPSDWNFWKEYSQELLRKCFVMVIIPADGWKDSAGVLGEIDFCLQNGIRYYVFDLAKLK